LEIPTARLDPRALLLRAFLLPSAIMLVLGLVGVYLYWFLHPLARVALAPGGLERITWPELAQAVRALAWTGRLGRLLRREGIPGERLTAALGFARLGPDARCAMVRARLGARTEGQPLAVGLIQALLPEDLLLGLDRLTIH
jgi:hypothetical protein